MKSFRRILQSLSNVNYLSLNSIESKNKKGDYKLCLLQNGLKLREELVKQWSNTSTSWAIQHGDIIKNDSPLKYYSRMSFLHSDAFQQTYKLAIKNKLSNSSNAILLKTIFSNIDSLLFEDDIFHCSGKNSFLVSEYFVAAESGLSKYYNLQRERKIWWMRFSANASRYGIEPFDFYDKGEGEDNLFEKCKSITIKANFPFGVVNMENITLVPLHEFSTLIPSENTLEISLIRSVINLDFTTCALILDACEGSTRDENNALMLNRKLAPYQILLASLHRGNKIVDELTLHLEHVISKSGLRLYDKFIRINGQSELEKNLLNFDNLGVPYTLVVDEESIKSGLMRLRSRDTTLFETIHISDIPNYILSIFKH